MVRIKHAKQEVREYNLHCLGLFVAWTCLSTAASVRPKKDETLFNNPPRLRVGTAAVWDFWDGPLAPGVETRLSPCDVNNINNIYVVRGRNLCSLQLELWETLWTHCDSDIMRYEKQDLRCIDESLAVSVVEGWLERCFAARTQHKGWSCADQWWSNARPDNFGEHSVTDLPLDPVPLAKGRIGPLHRHTKDLQETILLAEIDGDIFLLAERVSLEGRAKVSPHPRNWSSARLGRFAETLLLLPICGNSLSANMTT